MTYLCLLIAIQNPILLHCIFLHSHQVVHLLSHLAFKFIHSQVICFLFPPINVLIIILNGSLMSEIDLLFLFNFLLFQHF